MNPTTSPWVSLPMSGFPQAGAHLLPFVFADHGHHHNFGNSAACFMNQVGVHVLPQYFFFLISYFCQLRQWENQNRLQHMFIQFFIFSQSMKNSLNESSPPEGLPGTEAWKMCQSPDLRFWLHLLDGEDPAFKSGLYLVSLNHNQGLCWPCAFWTEQVCQRSRCVDIGIDMLAQISDASSPISCL